jgi:hypothetical protein
MRSSATGARRAGPRSPGDPEGRDAAQSSRQRVRLIKMKVSSVREAGPPGVSFDQCPIAPGDHPRGSSPLDPVRGEVLLRGHVRHRPRSLDHGPLAATATGVATGSAGSGCCRLGPARVAGCAPWSASAPGTAGPAASRPTPRPRPCASPARARAARIRSRSGVVLRDLLREQRAAGKRADRQFADALWLPLPMDPQMTFLDIA